ncbi:hypothetical protein [Sphingomonas sp. 35-24ZXX]|uniref:hypothetical protein n=1 Tax=Sphingomonas sp. 35-24ZXX TaxID=1545915 RepID=UPI000A53BF51|nr:hypothetical protein [Sphingomonas sp. 35-24ZXX]
MLKSLTGLGAAGAMLVTGFAPAMAAPVTAGAHGASDYSVLGDLAWDQGDEQAEQWRGGWGNRRWRGRNRGIDGGDILAGALILGGIAAVASAASNSARRNSDDRVSYNDDVRSASDRCGAAAVAQSGLGSRIERIDNVVRDGNGWRVEGLVGSRRSGVDSFTCGMSFGRIDYVTFNRANGAWGANGQTFQGQTFGDANNPSYVPPQPGDDDFAYRDDADPYLPE